MNPRRQRAHEFAAACGSLPSGIEQGTTVHVATGYSLLYSEVSGYMRHSEVHLGYVPLNACQAKQIYRSIRYHMEIAIQWTTIGRNASTALFSCLIIRTFQLIFLIGTVFFSHNKSA